MLRRALLLALPMSSALALASPALADTTVGQTGTPNAGTSFVAGFENINPSAVVPAAGTLTSFETQSAAAAVCAGLGTGAYDLQALRPEGSNQYLVLGDTGNQTDPCDGQLHSFPVTISVQPGDVLGVYVVRDWVGVLSGGSRQDGGVPEPLVGQTVTLPNPGANTIDLSATLVPTSDADLTLVNVPASVIADATSPAGTVVTYAAPTAADEEPAQASCAPASGTTFAIGTTTVTCSASDADDTNGPVQATFTVHIKGAAEQLSDLAGALSGMGPGRSLAHKVARIQFELASGRTRAACRTLEAFSHEVRAQTGRKIEAATAASLLAAAQRIEAVMGCHGGHDGETATAP